MSTSMGTTLSVKPPSKTMLSPQNWICSIVCMIHPPYKNLTRSYKSPINSSTLTTTKWVIIEQTQKMSKHL